MNRIRIIIADVQALIRDGLKTILELEEDMEVIYSAVAKWLADCGARNLVLVGRSGANRPEAKDMLQKLDLMGVKPVVECCDVSKEDQLRDVITAVKRSWGRGIFTPLPLVRNSTFSYVSHP